MLVRVALSQSNITGQMLPGTFPIQFLPHISSQLLDVASCSGCLYLAYFAVTSFSKLQFETLGLTIYTCVVAILPLEQYSNVSCDATCFTYSTEGIKNVKSHLTWSVWTTGWVNSQQTPLFNHHPPRPQLPTNQIFDPLTPTKWHTQHNKPMENS